MDEIKFIADNNLGKLVKLLRIIGFNTKEMEQHNHEQIVKISSRDNRIILTNDNKIIKTIEKENHNLSFILIKENLPDNQLMEVIKNLNLSIKLNNFFSRCTLCNAEIILKDRKEVKGKVPEHAYQVQDEFWYCPDCNKLYWAGTHWSRIIKRIIKILKKIE